MAGMTQSKHRGTFAAWAGAPECAEGDALSVAEAKDALGLRSEFIVNIRAATGALEPCWLAGEIRAVTFVSVERERSWWENASLKSRVLRRLLTPLHFVS